MDGVQQAYTAVSVDAAPGMGFGGGFEGRKPVLINDPIVTELPDGFEEWIKSDDNIPDNIREWLADISRALTGQPIETPRPVEPKLETEGSTSGDGQMSTNAQQSVSDGNKPPEKPNSTGTNGENSANSLSASSTFVLTGVRTSFIGVANE